MSAYRMASAPTPPRGRFSRVLALRFTRVVLEPERVAVDAPDMLALVTVLPLVAGLGLPLAWGWLGPWSLAALAVIALTMRVHLRVRPGRAVLVRTVLGFSGWGVPWWVSRRGADVVDGWHDWDFDGDDLVLPCTPEAAANQEATVPVLSTSFHGVRGEEIEEIARRCAEVLAGR